MSRYVRLEVITFFPPPSDMVKAELQALFDKWHDEKFVLTTEPEETASRSAKALYQLAVDNDQKWTMRPLPLTAEWAIYKPGICMGNEDKYLQSRKAITDILDKEEGRVGIGGKTHYRYEFRQVKGQPWTSPVMMVGRGMPVNFDMVVGCGKDSTVYTHLPNGKDFFPVVIPGSDETINVMGFVVAGQHRRVYDMRRQLRFWIRQGDKKSFPITAAWLINELVKAPSDDHIWLITDKNRALRITGKPRWVTSTYSVIELDQFVGSMPFIDKTVRVSNLHQPGINPDKFDPVEELERQLAMVKTIRNPEHLQKKLDDTVPRWPFSTDGKVFWNN